MFGKKKKPKKNEKKKEDQSGIHIEHDVDEKEHGGITQMLEKILRTALTRRASDIHIQPREKDVLVRMRIDGILMDVFTLEKETERPLVFKIKIASKIRTDEHFAPQDGRLSFVYEDTNVDTRVSVLPTSKGEKIVIRLLTSKGKDFKLEDLGLRERDREIVQRSYEKPYGMILSVGPTGSGKTTSLYTILKLINSPAVNITTVEDPVEYDIDGVSHVQINEKGGLSFSTGLRSILRQDPDIIMIGEIRDKETARIAINAAMTGHLVLSTLHTNDAVTSIPRLIDMGIEDYLVASTVNLIMAQRLARKLCEKCKEKYKISKKEHIELNRARSDIAREIKIGAQVYKAKGCSECTDTGFKGRIGLFEVLQVNTEIRQAINEGGTSDDIFKLARKQGMKLILDDGIEKLNQGVLSIKELFRVTAIKE